MLSQNPLYKRPPVRIMPHNIATLEMVCRRGRVTPKTSSLDFARSDISRFHGAMKELVDGILNFPNLEKIKQYREELTTVFNGLSNLPSPHVQKWGYEIAVIRQRLKKQMV